MQIPKKEFRYCQRDPRWADVHVGSTPFAIGKIGCAITALCYGINKLFPDRKFTPADAAKAYTFNAKGEIIWTQSKFEAFKFIWRGYSRDDAKIKEYTNNPNRFCIVQVDKYHWLYVCWHLTDSSPMCFDPWTGEWFMWCSPFKKYKKITGYAIFEKN